MSEQSEANNPERCSCCTCGHTWVKGQHGGHSCAQVMEVTIADLRARLAKYEDAEGRPVAGHLAVINKAYMALTGYLPGHRNAITDESIEACRSALNSSPVTVGDDDEYMPDGIVRAIMQSDEVDAVGLAAKSLAQAGVVDERAREALRECLEVMELQRLTGQVYANGRAALSAPSHGEQVLQMVHAWNLAADALPACGKSVLAYYMNSHGMNRTIRAMYVKRWEVEAEEFADPDTQCVEYSEQDDCYYTTEGWYELIDNWPDYASCAVIEGVITHWMPLPATPSAGSQGGDV